jgi:hypothetical protein
MSASFSASLARMCSGFQAAKLDSTCGLLVRSTLTQSGSLRNLIEKESVVSLQSLRV